MNSVLRLIKMLLLSILYNTIVCIYPNIKTMIQSSDLLLNHVSMQGYCIKLLSSFINYYLVIFSILSVVKEGQATPQCSMKTGNPKNIPEIAASLDRL